MAAGLLFEKAYGLADAARRVPFSPDAPTDGASLAKTFTAALLLDMQKARQLDLDQPVQLLLPELPYPSVTLRHLLSHTSGIPVTRNYDFFDPYVPPNHPPTASLCACMSHQCSTSSGRSERRGRLTLPL